MRFFFLSYFPRFFLKLYDIYSVAPKRFSISGQSKLLPPRTENTPRKCLALDLDETLVHSSFQYVANADFVIPVAIEDMVHNVYVLKRPGNFISFSSTSLIVYIHTIIN